MAIQVDGSQACTHAPKCILSSVVIIRHHILALPAHHASLRCALTLRRKNGKGFRLDDPWATLQVAAGFPKNAAQTTEVRALWAAILHDHERQLG